MSAALSLFRTMLGRNTCRGLAVLATLPLMVTACGLGPQNASASVSQPTRPVLHEITDSSMGATNSAEGFTFDSSITTLDSSHEYTFRILGPDGTPQTHYLYDQTKLLHFYAIRDDLTEFHHVHPTMAPDGTWSINLPIVNAGPYQLYLTVLLVDASGRLHKLTLRRSVFVPGTYKLSPVIPAPSQSAQVDGYTITFGPAPKPWVVSYWPAKITKNGQPVTDVQPYLAAFAHFTAFKTVSGLYGHAHPLEYAGAGREGWPDLTNLRGGPNLTFHAEFPGSGDYRAFVEFQTGGQLHTAAVTVHIP